MLAGTIVLVAAVAMLAVGLGGAFGVPGLAAVTGSCAPHCPPPKPSVSISSFSWSFSSLSGTFKVAVTGVLVPSPYSVTVNTGVTVLSGTATACSGCSGYAASTSLSYTYPVAGTYTVQAKACGKVSGTSYCASSSTATLVVTSGGISPSPDITASFSASQAQNSYNVTVTDTSTVTHGTAEPANTKWTFDFGAYPTRTGSSVIETFPGAGTYNVMMEAFATAANGTVVSNTTTQSVTVTAYDCTGSSCAAVIAGAFNWSISGPPANLTVTLTDQSTVTNGVITSITWSFGDHSPNATGNSTTHVYSVYGTFLVTETISAANSYGSTPTLTVSHNVTLMESTNQCYLDPSSCSTQGPPIFAVNGLNGALIVGGVGLMVLGILLIVSKGNPIAIVIGGVLFIIFTAAGYFLGAAGLL
jgi:hypothetical protein